MYSPHPNLPNISTLTDTLKRHVRDTDKEVYFVVVEGSRWWWCSSLVRAGNEQHSALSPNIFQRRCLPKRLGPLLLGSSQTQSAKKGARQKRVFPAELSRTPCWWLCVWWKSGKILSSPSSVGARKKSVSKSNQRIDRFFFRSARSGSNACVFSIYLTVDSNVAQMVDEVMLEALESL